MSDTLRTDHVAFRQKPMTCDFCGNVITGPSHGLVGPDGIQTFHSPCWEAYDRARRENDESESRLGIFKAVWYAAVGVALVVIVAWAIGGGP